MDMCGIEDLMANTMLVQAKNDTAANNKWRKNFRLPILTSTDDIVKKLEVELHSQIPERVERDQALRMLFEFSLYCEKQCIGKELFNQYCQKANQKVKNVNALMQAIHGFEVAEGDERMKAALSIVTNYLSPDASCSVAGISEETRSTCVEVVTSKSTPDYEKIRDKLNAKNKSGTTNLASAVSSNQPDLILTSLSETEKRFYFMKLLFERCKQQMYPYLAEEVYPTYKKSEEFHNFLRWKTKEKEQVSDEDFIPFRLLGRGGFGEVFAYQVKCTGKFYACKKIDKKKMKQKNAQEVVMSEKITLEMVNSPFVVSLVYAYENKNHLNLAMTLMGAGDLKFHIYDTANNKKRGISPERTWFYTAQITLGLDHLHASQILYRDMKPENVLLDNNGNVRIADLGLVCILGEGKKTSGRAGTIGFMAPEMLQNEPYAYGVDWFALGCTIYEMAEGKGPFVVKGKNKKRMSTNATIEKTIHEKHSFKRSHSEELVDLIDQLLLKDVTKRLAGDEPSAGPIKQHRYFATLNWDRLEAGLLPAPFIPDPKEVYAKDVSDIRVASEAKGVVLTDEDKDYHKKFSSGKIPIPWQHEIMETGLFHEVMNRQEADDAKEKKKQNRKSSICLLL